MMLPSLNDSNGEGLKGYVEDINDLVKCVNSLPSWAWFRP